MIAVRRLAVPAALALALLVTGCSAPAGNGAADRSQSPAPATSSAAPASDQSKTDACQVVQDVLFDVGSLSGVDTTDPQGALDALQGAQEKLDASAAKVTHADVKPAVDNAATAIGDFVDFFEQIMSDPENADIDGMSERVENFKDSLLALGEACA